MSLTEAGMALEDLDGPVTSPSATRPVRPASPSRPEAKGARSPLRHWPWVVLTVALLGLLALEIWLMSPLTASILDCLLYVDVEGGKERCCRGLANYIMPRRAMLPMWSSHQ